MESRKFEPFVVSVCLRYGVCTALEAALEAVEVHTRDQRPRVPLPPHSHVSLPTYLPLAPSHKWLPGTICEQRIGKRRTSGSLI